MTDRTTRYLVIGGVIATVACMVGVLFNGVGRLSASGSGRRNEAGGTTGLMESTNKVAFVRDAAARMDSSAVPGLTMCLRRDPEVAVRVACAEALGRLNDDRAKPDLALCLVQDPSPEVRRAVALAFETSGMAKEDKFFEALVKRLAEDRSPEVRREIVLIMSRLGTHDARRAISSRISDEDAGVRDAVGKAFSVAVSPAEEPSAQTGKK